MTRARQHCRRQRGRLKESAVRVLLLLMQQGRSNSRLDKKATNGRRLRICFPAAAVMQHWDAACPPVVLNEMASAFQQNDWFATPGLC